MNTTNETHATHGLLAETLAGNLASVPERIGAIGTIILAILGLAGIYDNIVASVAAIVMGAAFLTDGLAASAASRRMHLQGTMRPAMEWGGGVNAGFFAGLASVVLGILSFFRITSQTLLAVTVLVLGGALLLGAGAAATRMAWLAQSTSANLQGTAAPISSGSMFVGIAAVVLGILAIVGLAPMTLVLVGFLVLGAGALFSGPAASTTV